MNAFVSDDQPPFPAREQVSLSFSLLLGDQTLALSHGLTQLLGAECLDLGHLCEHLEPASVVKLQQALTKLSLATDNQPDFDLMLTFKNRLSASYRCRLQVLFKAKQPVIIQAQLQPAVETFGDRQELFSLLAHDVRNALSSIAGFAQLLKRRELLSEAASPLVERMRQAAANAHELLQEMLFTQEQASSTVAPGFLRNCLDDTLRWFTIQAREKEVGFEAVLPQHLPDPAIAPIWLERVLRHLLDNALKFTPAGGQIELSLEAPSQQRVRFVLRDTGLGIPPERQARIFAKTASRDDDGSGLGLYIVQQIIQHHGGSVWFESQTNQGSIFYLELPVI